MNGIFFSMFEVRVRSVGYYLLDETGRIWGGIGCRVERGGVEDGFKFFFLGDLWMGRVFMDL